MAARGPRAAIIPYGRSLVRSQYGSVNDPHAQREVCDLRRVVEVELLHGVLAVALDGVEAHREEIGDLLVGLALGDELEHLALAIGELLEVVPGVAPVAIAVEQHAGDSGAE